MDTIATLFYRKGSKVKPDFYIHEITDKWIVFPYESDIMIVHSERCYACKRYYDGSCLGWAICKGKKYFIEL